MRRCRQNWTAGEPMRRPLSCALVEALGSLLSRKDCGRFHAVPLGSAWQRRGMDSSGTSKQRVTAVARKAERYVAACSDPVGRSVQGDLLC
jgi:NADH:ubiquinone oxidoreductase subunit B-like Fe-S oxidoreductase